jgi:hydrogenase/urease accessory protein HupE
VGQPIDSDLTFANGRRGQEAEFDRGIEACTLSAALLRSTAAALAPDFNCNSPRASLTFEIPNQNLNPSRESAWLKALLALALLAIVDGARAHEIGTTQVHLTLHKDHTWSAKIATPPTPLLNRLEAAAGQRLSSSGLDQNVLSDKLDALRQDIARRIEVKFDGVASPVDVSFAWVGELSDIKKPLGVVLETQGPIPKGAQEVTWRYDLVQSTYGVVFASEGTENTETQWLEGDAPSEPFPASADIKPPATLEIVAQYLQLGFRHVVQGLDHILFVLGIFLLATELKPVLVQVTSFTVAHSLTVGLAMSGVLLVSSRIVEPLISLSIAYVAIENIVIGRLTPWRPAVVFGFGLFHGMGFAGALRELHVPHGQFLPALISFNVGIELAQLSVIAAAFVSVAMWRRKPWYRSRVSAPASAAIAATGLIWAFQLIVAGPD